MAKTTKSFNKLLKLFLFSLLPGGALNAQCPNNITVTNDANQCGAVVEYAIQGSGSGASANGIINPAAANGTTGWTVTNGGDGWVTTGGYWLSSYTTCTMSQVIDLTSMNLTDTYMDTQPAITVSENYIGWGPNYSDIYSLTVQLRGESNNIIATYTTGNITTSATQGTASHIFTAYGAGVRKVYISHTGKDVEYWAGQYGAAVTNASLTVAVPTSTIVQTAGIESGELFPIGTTINTFTITDSANVTSTCSFNVVVTDNSAPVAVAHDVIIAELDQDGVAAITVADVNEASTDNCTNLTYALSLSSFTCENLGENTVNFSVSDGTNTTTIPVTINVVDVIDSTVATQDISIEINSDGEAVITAEEVNNGSSDNCSISSYTLSKSIFTCEDMGANTVILTAIDADGNTGTATATVTVIDTTAPTAVAQDITIQLPMVTIASISVMDINNDSTDNCGISTYSLDNQIFTCENIGENTVTLTVTDNYGNISTATAIVTVEDPENYCQFAGVDQNLSKAINLYPNPTNDVVNIDATGYNIDKVEIYDIQARLVKTFSAAKETGIFSADITSLNSGIYIIKLHSGENSVIKKIIKQ